VSTISSIVAFATGRRVISISCRIRSNGRSAIRAVTASGSISPRAAARSRIGAITEGYPAAKAVRRSAKLVPVSSKYAPRPTPISATTPARFLFTSLSTIQWVSTGYLLAMFAAIPAVGWLQARLGGKHLRLASLTVFLLGPLLGPPLGDSSCTRWTGAGCSSSTYRSLSAGWPRRSGYCPASGIRPKPDAGTSRWLLMAVLFVRGLGMGVVATPIMSVTYLGLEPAEMPDASIMVRIAQQLGGSLYVSEEFAVAAEA